jgi:protein-S-isoprenylcysteine O-methyltransferase Ste14
MQALDLISAVIVIGSMVYLTFALTIPQWIQLLQKGEGVALWPQRGDGEVVWWKQLVMILIGIVLGIVLFRYLWIPFSQLPEPALTGLRIAGLVLYIGGFAFMMWARTTLGRNWGISTSLKAKLQADHELVQHGPYKVVRHPMYFGALVLSVGAVLVYPMWVILILAVSMMFSLTMRARREEAVLAERFGKAWEDYKMRTRFLIPYLF